jgi:glutamyl-tRNA reductase
VTTTAPAPDAILAFVTHARHVPALERERFAARLRDDMRGRALVLETCHRVEAYLVATDDAAIGALQDALPAGGRLLRGDAAVRHAITVAVGRDSVVVGEDQVLHQLRESVDEARKHGLDPTLERLMALALRAGRRARSWRRGPVRSLADVAWSAIERQSGSLRDRDVLVVGAGRMGRLAVAAASASGASVWIANRTKDRAMAIASSTGAHLEAFDPGPLGGRFAGVVVALGGPWPIGQETLAALAASATVVVDLSVPAAVSPSFAQVLGSRLVPADALALAEDDDAGLERGSLVRLDALADATAAEFLDWLRVRDGRAAAEALVAHADRERQAEVDALWRVLPDLEPDAREAIERMSRHLANRLLREPLERLGRDADGSVERAARELFAL